MSESLFRPAPIPTERPYPHDTPEGALLRLLLVAGRRVLDHRHRGDTWRRPVDALVAAASRNLAQALPTETLALSHVDLADMLVYAAFALSAPTASSPEECLLRYTAAAIRVITSERPTTADWRTQTAEAHIAAAASLLSAAALPDAAQKERDAALVHAGISAAYAAYLLSLETDPERVARPSAS